MRLCFSTLVCPRWSFPEIVGAAAAYGIEGIDPRGIGDEIDVTKSAIFGEELDSTLELLRRHRLEIPCLQTSVALVTPGDRALETMLDDFHRYAVLAGRLSSRYIRIFGGAIPKEMTRAEALSMALRRARQLIKICAGHGCQILIETHDDWSTSEELRPLVEGFDPEEFGVLWDIEHPYRRGERLEETAGGLGRYVRHVHFKDSLRQEGRSVPALIGEGNLPVREFLEVLAEMGYDRWICLETEKRWHPETAPEPEQSIPRFVGFVREHWSCRSGSAGQAV